jgi:hypothetical protein
MAQEHGRRWRAFRRTIVVGTTSGLALLGGLAPGATASGSPTAPAQAADFSNGMAKATAFVTKVAPGVGALELALGSGVAVSELRNQLAQAQAQSFDLGLIGTTLTAEGCRDAAITADQLPQPTRVDNRKGDTDATTDEAPLGGSSLGGGREHARATTIPSATAVATTAASETPLITIDGGQASATTEVVDGPARQARASTRLNLTIAGVLELEGLRWDAVHRTGADPRAEASFSIGSGTLGGIPLPLDDLATAQDLINEALAPTGLSVDLPRVERFEEPNDLIRVTPLRISMRDSEVGATVLGPVLNATRAQREQLFDELSAAVCEMAGILLVGDVGVSVAAGTGFLVTDIGGAEALSGEFVAENPFGAAIPPALAPPARPPDPAGTAAGGPAPSTGPGSAPTSPPPSDAVASQPVAAVGPLERLCESIHPLRAPGCSEGALAPLGLLGLLATGAVAGLDWRHQQRRLGRPAATS